MHVEHILGLYVFAANERSCPTNMHNTVLAVNSAHKIRFAQDLALYNLTLSEEIESFDGAAHVDAWNNDPEMQGVREVTEALTAVEDDWGEAMFATNVVFEPLVGELFRSGFVMHTAPAQGDFVTPTIMGLIETEYERDLNATRDMFTLLAEDEDHGEDNKHVMQGWLSKWGPYSIAAAQGLEPIWSEPEVQTVSFEESFEKAKSRFEDILSDIGLQLTEEVVHQ
jgi:propane 2-monooxygenase small subunit